MASGSWICGLSVLFFVAPLWLGVRLGLTSSEKPLRQLASWLTLKPFVATPLWALLVGALGQAADARYVPYLLMSVGVGLGLTIAIVWNFRAFIGQYSGSKVWLLLILDTVRWGNTVLLGLLLIPSGGLNILLALALPTIFAIAAWMICGDE